MSGQPGVGAASYGFFASGDGDVEEEELGGELEDEPDLQKVTLENDEPVEEVDISELQEDDDLSFTAMFARKAALGAGAGAAPAASPAAPRPRAPAYSAAAVPTPPPNPPSFFTSAALSLPVVGAQPPMFGFQKAQLSGAGAGGDGSAPGGLFAGMGIGALGAAPPLGAGWQRAPPPGFSRPGAPAAPPPPQPSPQAPPRPLALHEIEQRMLRQQPPPPPLHLPGAAARLEDIEARAAAAAAPPRAAPVSVEELERRMAAQQPQPQPLSVEELERRMLQGGAPPPQPQPPPPLPRGPPPPRPNAWAAGGPGLPPPPPGAPPGAAPPPPLPRERQLQPAGAGWTSGPAATPPAPLPPTPPPPAPGDRPRPPPDAPAGPAREAAPSPAPSAGRRRRYTAKYMEQEEIDFILRIQWAANHPQDVDPYEHDYYALALAHRRSGAGRKPPAAPQGPGQGRLPQQQPFAPRALRELVTRSAGGRAERFVNLEGLGKVAYSSLRRPKPLLDIDWSQPQKEGGADADGEGAQGTLSLEKEPRFAVRIMIEDCLTLLLDLDDADRLLAAGGHAPDRAAAVEAQRALILQDMAEQFQLPDYPECPRGEEATDRILLAACSLPKGRAMIADLIGRYPKGSPLACKLVWGVCRNLSVLVAPQPQPKRGLADSPGAPPPAPDATAAAIVRAAAAAAAGFDAAQLCGVLAAVVAGASAKGRAFPPVSPATPAGDAVAALLAAVLRKAAAAGLGGEGKPAGGKSAPPPKTAALWGEQFKAFFGALSLALASVMQKAVATCAAGADKAAAAAACEAVPAELLRQAIPHCAAQQQQQLTTFLQMIGAGGAGQQQGR